MPDLAAVHRELERLAAAVQAVSATQQTQTDLIRLIVEAATGEAGEDPIQAELTGVADILDRHAHILARIEAALGASRSSTR